MRVWSTTVGDVVEEMDLLLLQGQGGSDAVNGSVAPSFVKEAAIVVEGLKQVHVCF